MPLVVDGPEKGALAALAMVALALGLGVSLLAGATVSRKALPLVG